MKDLLHPATTIALVWTGFQIYTAAWGNLPVMLQRPLHVVLALALTFLLYSPKGEKTNRLTWEKGLGGGTALALGLYFLLAQERLLNRVWFVDPVTTLDLAAGIALILLLLEGARRLVGWPLPLVTLAFIGYGFTGPWFPGLLYHRGISLAHFMDQQFLSTGGVFGLPTGVANNYVFYFVLFAAFLEISGAGQLFVDLAFSLTRGTRGGSAKAAVLASSLMGTINGSAVANVAGTGVFTIPLMKRSGYPGPFAAAVEACASTGGQLLPPIMGAAAFILAETIGMPYSSLLLPAALPALLYYLALLVMVDLKAREQGIRLTHQEEVGPRVPVGPRLYLLLPMVTLVYLMARNHSLMAAAMGGMGTVILLGIIPGSHRLTMGAIITALAKGAKKALTITIPCALAGVIIGVIVYSGLALKFTSLIVSWSGGNLLAALLLVALGCIILGMGMPTSSAYIMGAVLMAPALVELGVPPLAAHLFILYFAILSMVTPPVALAAYAAGGIAETSMGQTGWQAFQLSLPGFLVPFAFVLNPALILQGPWFSSLVVTLTALVGVIAISAAVIGFFRGRLSAVARVFLGIGAVALLSPQYFTDLAGLLLLLAVFGQHFRQRQGVPKRAATT